MKFNYFFFIENEDTNYLWNNIRSRHRGKIFEDDYENEAQNFVLQNNRKQNRRVRKMRNKKDKRFKLKRLYPARVNESDIIELKKKESMNMVVLSSEKIGKQKDTKPFSGI